jgi:hypothetical protein
MHRDWQERRKIGLDDAIDLADSRMALEIRQVYRLPRATLSPGVAGARSHGTILGHPTVALCDIA